MPIKTSVCRTLRSNNHLLWGRTARNAGGFSINLTCTCTCVLVATCTCRTSWTLFKVWKPPVTPRVLFLHWHPGPSESWVVTCEFAAESPGSCACETSSTVFGKPVDRSTKNIVFWDSRAAPQKNLGKVYFKMVEGKKNVNFSYTYK